MNKKIAFLGAGSMAEAIISGLTARSSIKPEQLWVMNRSNDAQLERLRLKNGITPCRNIPELLADASVVIVAVKPKDVLSLLLAAKPYLKENMLLISVAAGIATSSLEAIVGMKMPIIRAMPNTSAAVGKSATALSGNQFALSVHCQMAEDIFNTVGMTLFTEEEKMDAITGLSGSGPAYIYYLIEAMEQSATLIGLEEDKAQALIIQTLIGAAEMVQSSSKKPEALRKDVTSPGGTTEAGIRVLEQNGVKEALISCIREATIQSARMGKELKEKIELEIENKME